MLENRQPARIIPCIVTAFLLAACAPEPATYPAPDNDQALSAMKNGIRADFIDLPPRHAMPEDPEIRPGDSPAEGMKKVGGTLLSMKEENSRADAQGRIDRLASVEIGPCEWEAVSLRRVKDYARPRFEDKIPAAYRCDYRVTSITTTRGPVSATGVGYFYKEGDDFLHAIIEQSNWEEDRR